MKMNGTRKSLVAIRSDERIPVELRFGEHRIDVWLDHRGIHFRQEEGHVTEGHLPWDVAIAMSLMPPEWRHKLPSA